MRLKVELRDMISKSKGKLTPAGIARAEAYNIPIQNISSATRIHFQELNESRLKAALLASMEDSQMRQKSEMQFRKEEYNNTKYISTRCEPTIQHGSNKNHK